jgi:hypothetical protein
VICLRLGQRRLEILDVDSCGIGVAHLDGRVAGGRLAPGTAGVAENALCEFGKLREILIDECISAAAETIEPILDVRRVTRLRHLAIVDDVDSRIGLLAHHFEHGRAHSRRKRGAIDGHPLLLGVHDLDQVFGARQAAGMRGQKPLGAANHHLATVATARGSGASVRLLRIRG